MSDITDPLAQPCSDCGKPLGDHTMREWVTHPNAGRYEVPFLEIDEEPTGPIQALITDTVDLRCMVAEGGPLGPLGVVEMHWQIGNPIGINRSVAKVALIGRPDLLRTAGRMLRDAMNRAANVAEGKR